MTERSTESFRLKVLRMFFPVNPRIYEKGKKSAEDIELVDPLERFEKSILKDSESKSRDRAKKGS